MVAHGPIAGYNYSMQEIFDQVLNKEDEAAKIIAQAREREARIVSDAEKYYNDTLKAARKKNREKFSEAMEKIRLEQNERKDSILNDYEKQWIHLQEQGDEKVAELAVKLAEIAAGKRED